MRNKILLKVILTGVALALVGCLQDKVTEEGTEVDITPTAPDPDTYVCNPLTDGADNLDRQQGVLGRLFYLEPGEPTLSRAEDYINLAHPAGVDLYFNQLHIPTRPFDRGFVTQGGLTLATSDGTTLYEWFGIRFEGELKLAEGQTGGLYQLAILSDDGAVLTLGEGAEAREWINNDGWTSTRMRCATEAVELQPGQSIPFRLDYFQGPRYHIALVVMMRPWPASPADGRDPLCDRSGNSFWFDSTQDPPAPTANYNALLTRGWSPLAPGNYRLPASEVTNPCNEPAPVLSTLSVSAVSREGATVTWLTDIPATSQVIITESATGIVAAIPNPEDPNLVTNHLVAVSGLKSNTLYRVKAVSKSSSGRSAESSEVTFRTAR